MFGSARNRMCVALGRLRNATKSPLPASASASHSWNASRTNINIRHSWHSLCTTRYGVPIFSRVLAKSIFCDATHSQLSSSLLSDTSNDSNNKSSANAESTEAKTCPGCGVNMQSQDPKAPGFFQKPTNNKKKQKNKKNPNSSKIWVDPQELPPELQIQLASQETEKSESEVSNSSNQESGNPKLQQGRPTVCARCHSLRNYGKVKDEGLENLLPAFDFNATIGPRLMKSSGARCTVVMVVDVADFDGSFPRRVASLIGRVMEEGQSDWKEGKSGNVPRLLLVATKLDLLPTDVTPERLDKWVRQRARFGGAEKLHGVHLVSAHKGWGIANLAEHIKELTGIRGHVWVIGAQNAGKSTLINAIGKHAGGKISHHHLTEAPVPGTTLGIMRIDGILGGNKTKLFDTPGLLHPYQIGTRLSLDEQRLLQIRKQLKPKTYRLVAGHSVYIGGLARVDIQHCDVGSVYVSVWASPCVPLHMGKIENADSLKENHFGTRLQPPLGAHRVRELGEWKPREFRISGNSWEFNSMDVAVAGLGWLSFSLKGEVTVSVWTYDGIDVTSRSALILHRAKIFEDHGFTVSEVVSQADKQKQQKEKISKVEISKEAASKKCGDIKEYIVSKQKIMKS